MVFDYYYDNLSADEKRIYDIVNTNQINYVPEFRVDGTSQQIHKVMFLLANMEYSGFHVESYMNSYLENYAIIRPDYCYTQSERKEIMQKIEDKTAPIIKEALKIDNSLEREKYLYSWIVNNYKYKEDLHTTVEAFLNPNGEANCRGLAYMFKYLCDKANIVCIKTDGKMDVDHAWDMVQINGKWYVCDVSVDVSFMGNAKPLYKNAPPSMLAFNLSDDIMNKFVKHNKDFPLPKAGENLNNCVVTDKQGVDKILNCFSKNKKDVLQIVFTNDELFDYFKSKYMASLNPYHVASIFQEKTFGYVLKSETAFKNRR